MLFPHLPALDVRVRPQCGRGVEHFQDHPVFYNPYFHPQLFCSILDVQVWLGNYLRRADVRERGCRYTW